MPVCIRKPEQGLDLSLQHPVWKQGREKGSENFPWNKIYFASICRCLCFCDPVTLKIWFVPVSSLCLDVAQYKAEEVISKENWNFLFCYWNVSKKCFCNLLYLKSCFYKLLWFHEAFKGKNFSVILLHPLCLGSGQDRAVGMIQSNGTRYLYISHQET